MVDIKFFSGFFLLFFVKDMLSYKFLAGFASGYVFSHRHEFAVYRDVVEPYTDPYLDMAAEKIKDIKKTFDEISAKEIKEIKISKGRTIIVEDTEPKSYYESIVEKLKK